MTPVFYNAPVVNVGYACQQITTRFQVLDMLHKHLGGVNQMFQHITVNQAVKFIRSDRFVNFSIFLSLEGSVAVFFKSECRVAGHCNCGNIWSWFFWSGDRKYRSVYCTDVLQ